MSGDAEREKAEPSKFSHPFNEEQKSFNNEHSAFNDAHSAFQNELLPYSGDRLHQLSASQIEEANAKSLADKVNDIRSGNASAGGIALQEIHEMKDGNYLQGMARDLEQSGSAKVSYGKDGEVEHLIFNAKDGGAPIDIDVKGDKVNGRSADQLRVDSVQQSKEYLAASLADPKIKDSTGKPLSAETQEAAKQLMGALLDGNIDSLTKTAQDIMKNPQMAKDIESAYRRISIPNPITFGTDNNGKPFMQTTEGLQNELIVPASGAAYAASVNYLGNPEFDKPSADLQKTLKEASDQALFVSSESAWHREN